MAEYKGFRADRLKKVMKEHGVTMEDLAESLAEVTYTDTPIKLIIEEIDEIINGNYIILTSDELFAICDACNC